MDRRALVCFALALLVASVLLACSGAELHVVEPPSRRLGGSFVVAEPTVDPRISDPTARRDAELLVRELRGALAVVASDGAGDDRFVVHLQIEGYDDALVVSVDIRDRVGRRLTRFEVTAPASKRGWTDAAREDARAECVLVIASYLRSNR